MSFASLFAHNTALKTCQFFSPNPAHLMLREVSQRARVSWLMLVPPRPPSLLSRALAPLLPGPGPVGGCKSTEPADTKDADVTQMVMAVVVLGITRLLRARSLSVG